MYKLAAEAGETDGVTHFGCLYMNGKGIAVDIVEGFNWFKRSAEQRNTDRIDYLANCYLLGKGVAVDTVEAFKWFRRSVEEGEEADAKFRLAVCYMKT